MLAERFRLWYRHECAANAKILATIDSIPPERRTEPDFQNAIDLMAHLMTARRNWLARMGIWSTEQSDWFPRNVLLDDLRAELMATEHAWTKYLDEIDDDEIVQDFEWSLPNGDRWRWNVEGVLTQVNGHAWYHRGQIVHMLDRVGADTVDTDFIFWSWETLGTPKKVEAV